jgi:hypothetical protein
MNSKKISVLGVILGVIAGALMVLISGSWIFWLAIGVALGLLLGGVGVGRKSDRIANGRLPDDRLSNNRPTFGHGASV